MDKCETQDTTHTPPILKHKVCYVVMAFPQPSETFISDEAASLYKHGIEPHILSVYEGDTSTIHPSAQKLLDDNNVTYVKHISRINSLKHLFWLSTHHPAKALTGLSKAFSNKRERWRYFQILPYACQLLKNKINIIHAHFADQNLIIAKILSDWSSLPFGVTTHGYDLREAPITKQCFSDIACRIHHIVTISQYNKSLMAKKFNLQPDQIHVVHCGIRLDFFIPSKSKHTDKTLRLINIGRLVPVKGQEILLIALAKLKNKGIEFNLRIIGDGPLRKTLQQLAIDLKISEYIEFLGTKSQPEILNELNHADIYVMPSLSEGIPVACMEAMAMELPIITTRITGLTELIDDGINGILVPANDPLALEDAIHKLSKNPEQQKLMGKAARKTIEQKFEREHNTKQLISIWGID